MKIFIDGFISTQFSGKDVPQYEKLISFFHKIKIISGGFKEEYHWDKFLITPHIFTEICTHIKNEYRTNHNYCDIIKNIIPILGKVKEFEVKKDNILNHVNMNNPIIEIGDISIFLTIENYERNNEKIAVLEKDGQFLKDYGNNKKVMVIDFDLTMLAMEEL